MYSTSWATAGLLALSWALTPVSALSDYAAIERVQRPSRCPDTCSSYDPSSWFVYSSMSRVARCNETVLLDFNIYNDLNNTQSHSTIHTCVVDGLSNLSGGSQGLSATEIVKSNITYVIGTWDSTTTSPSDSSDNGSSYLLEDLANYMTANIQKSLIFGYSNSTAAGIYVGPNLQSSNNVEQALRLLSSAVQSDRYGAVVIQYCGADSNRTLGIALDLNGDMTAVQKYVQAWHSGECITGFDQTTSVNTLGWMRETGNIKKTAHNNGTTVSIRSRHGHNHLHPRTSTCSYVQVVSGDSCATLVSECDITDAEFYDYNTASDLCSTLAVGQYICCSSGALPDFAPSAYSNGTCYTYDVQSGDTCSEIAAENSITVDEIDNYNNNTWGWYGCDDLQAGQSICLSTGNVPYPLPIANAACGPQVNGTVFNSSDSWDWGGYNPCPLNACCDVWGQCGTTPEYCNDTLASSGAPGTAANGSDGCIFNCGTTITNWVVPPSNYSAIGYYEASSVNRSCLQMWPESIDLSEWTHVYFAFGNIASDFSINMDDMEEQFEQFVALSGVKRIVSFGGWDFSTDIDTYMIFREGTDATNRDTLAQNVANFVSDTGVDGVDFDWEYPGEPDIPGIPAGSSDEGDNYLAFLKLVRSYLPSDSILSITAPSSYWYLKQFPISDMADVVDYINYMTYDLHGTWDLGSEWADLGCTAGDCLFSHINMTETMWALAMITKAGIATNQVMVGVSSYGRSFHMTEAGCTASDCTWDTGGAAGECTDTVGYISNAEINSILASDSSANFTSTSDTDFIVYNSTQWVGYMTNDTKVERQAYYETYNFAGTSEWAIDLEAFVSSDSTSSDSDSDDTGGQTIYIDPDLWTKPTPVVTCSPPCYMIMPPKPLATNTTIDFPEWCTHISWRATEVQTTTLIDDSVDVYSLFPTYTIPTCLTIQPIQTNYINVWNQQITPGQTIVHQTSSIEPSPFPITFIPTVGGNTTVIGGTTSTISGVAFSSGNLTYTSSPYTGVFGGSTSVVGGTTLSPTTSTVTPHPYPTTTNTPDPELNTVTTTVKAQSSTSLSGPSCPASSHCGGHCWIFCVGGCPECPPGFGGFGGSEIGSSGGGGESGEEEDSSTSTSSSTSTPIGTVTVWAAGVSEIAETGMPSTDDLADLNSVGEEIGAKFSTLYASAQYSATASGVWATATSNPLCIEEQDPDSGTDDTWCSCSGSSEKVTTMSGSSPCGYTALPTMTTSNEYPYTFADAYGDAIACATEGFVDGTISYCSGSRTTISINPTGDPYPYTFADPDGDIIACATEGFVDGTISYCTGSRTTISTATPTATSYPWAMWTEYEYEDDCIDAHCVEVMDSHLMYAGPEASGKVCDSSELSVAQGSGGLGLGGVASVIKFEDGICGSGIAYWCNSTSSDLTAWNCADADGGNVGECVYVHPGTITDPAATCFDWKREGDTFYYMTANCTGPWECT
ncbi:uncharacterized protein N7483_008783 [Penicillium malachiteum]|uniref:uncharacterized protein n=1 Tax=Penicillium malachiteum TaxID=1324776 RepID=UPI0025466968|nr:uncharacterized protein N7483_008783 [Penicillium malachiteum]KAJ5720849.1 hypothetical protein N7483_008783 [Penicillium malachiteum]